MPKQLDSVYSNGFCSFMSDFISVYYYDCVYIIILVYSYRTHKECFCSSPAVGVQRSRNNQKTNMLK